MTPTPKTIQIAAIAAGAVLAFAAYSGYSQERWINAQNQRIALAYSQTPKQHSSPLWGALGLGGLAAIGYGAIAMKGDNPNPNPVLSEPQPQPQPRPKPSMIQIQKKDDVSWLKNFFADAHHVALNGSTGSGKTTLAEWAISQQDSEVYLIDPKHIPHSPRWNFDPNCSDISEVPIHLEALNKRMENRRSGEEAIAPLNIIIDEWDWIAEEHGKSAISQLRKLFKVGRELGLKIWICGQSPLAKDAGLSGSDFRNFGRVVLNSEAISFCKNPQFPWDSSEYKPIAESHQKKGDRFGLFVPMVGEPFIKSIPDLSQFSPVQSYQLESSPHPPERSGEPIESSNSEWLNALLDIGDSDSECLNDWEPRDPMSDSEPSPEAIGMVVTLHRSGCSKQECIEYTWKCKKGGSKAYKKAEKYYEQTVQNLGASNNG